MRWEQFEKLQLFSFPSPPPPKEGLPRSQKTSPPPQEMLGLFAVVVAITFPSQRPGRCCVTASPGRLFVRRRDEHPASRGIRTPLCPWTRSSPKSLTFCCAQEGKAEQANASPNRLWIHGGLQELGKEGGVGGRGTRQQKWARFAASGNGARPSPYPRLTHRRKSK